jgi:hypothetical protein
VSGDLTFDLAALRQLAEELIAVSAVLTNKTRASQFNSADIGHHLVAGAMEDFKNNWDDKRELLVGDIEKVGGMAEQSAEVLKDADDELAKKVHAILHGDA